MRVGAIFRQKTQREVEQGKNRPRDFETKTVSPRNIRLHYKIFCSHHTSSIYTSALDIHLPTLVESRRGINVRTSCRAADEPLRITSMMPSPINYAVYLLTLRSKPSFGYYSAIQPLLRTERIQTAKYGGNYFFSKTALDVYREWGCTSPTSTGKASEKTTKYGMSKQQATNART